MGIRVIEVTALALTLLLPLMGYLMIHSGVKPPVTYPVSQSSGIGNQVLQYLRMINVLIENNPSLVKDIQPLLGNMSVNSIMGKLNQYVSELNNYVEYSLTSLQSGDYSEAEDTALKGISTVNSLYSLANKVNLTTVNIPSNYREFTEQLLNITYSYLNYVNSTLTSVAYEAKAIKVGSIIEESINIPSEVTWGRVLNVSGCLKGVNGVVHIVVGNEEAKVRLINGCFNASLSTLSLNPGNLTVRLLINDSLLEVRRLMVTPGNASVGITHSSIALAGSPLVLSTNEGKVLVIKAAWVNESVNSTVVKVPVPLTTLTNSYIVTAYVEASNSTVELVEFKVTVINIIQLIILALSAPVAYALLKLRVG